MSKKKLIDVKASFSMPCNPAWFRIKGKDPFLTDFGNWVHGNKDECPDENIKNWGCYQRTFKTYPVEKSAEALKTYNLSEEEYTEVCRKLEEVFNVGTCGWCV